VEKLGIKEGVDLIVLNAPSGYEKTLGALPANVKVKTRLQGPFGFLHFFCTKKSELESRFPALKRELAPDGMLWISWPKRSSKVPTDLNENVIREIGLKNGLVDVKVCAVDEIWSSLKFVFRTKDRKI
jgi:hypothetical protein